jgi:hypothetical protein
MPNSVALSFVENERQRHQDAQRKIGDGVTALNDSRISRLPLSPRGAVQDLSFQRSNPGRTI